MGDAFLNFFLFLCFVTLIISYFVTNVKHKIKLFSKNFHTQRVIPIVARIQNTRSISPLPLSDHTTINNSINYLYIK